MRDSAAVFFWQYHSCNGVRICKIHLLWNHLTEKVDKNKKCRRGIGSINHCLHELPIHGLPTSQYLEKIQDKDHI